MRQSCTRDSYIDRLHTEFVDAHRRGEARCRFGYKYPLPAHWTDAEADFYMAGWAKQFQEMARGERLIVGNDPKDVLLAFARDIGHPSFDPDDATVRQFGTRFNQLVFARWFDAGLRHAQDPFGGWQAWEIDESDERIFDEAADQAVRELLGVFDN